jgi:hypothetical protein
MADTSGDLNGLMDKMTLTHTWREEQKTLQEKNQELVLVAETLIRQARQVQTMTEDTDIALDRHVAAIHSLRRKAIEIEAITQSVNDAAEDYIFARILSLASENHDVNDLLLHFQPELRKIVKTVLEATTTNQHALLGILETCYTQSLSQQGVLHSDNYFIPQEEAALCSRFDPDFESEEYYEHENRSQIEQGYAKSHYIHQQQKSERRMEYKRNTNRAWIRSWMRLLSSCVGGPTLFWPLTNSDRENNLPESPRYLFRTFDSESSGKSDDVVVASLASLHMGPDVSRKDFMSMEREEASKKLSAHLSKDCFGGGSYSDNFMSWSSSLLFVIQYAIWRCYRRGCSPADIKICAVDTTRFPHGQFARDMWLIEKCQSPVDGNHDIQKLVRLRQSGYDNGEYLSQGVLNHKSRSCVVTLERLGQAGLYDLYPEFNEPEGRGKWTNRVRDLRLQWKLAKSTARGEIRVAFQIADSCFNGLGAFNIALLLLTFKAREIRKGPTRGRFLLTGL